MIQFNLLPDVKLAFIKAERTKRLVISISVLAGSVALVVFVLLFVAVNVIQKKNITDLNGDIQTTTNKIKSTENLDKILTIQSQLAGLTPLHDQKAASSRLFTYIGQLTPASVTISNVTTDFSTNTMVINGGAPGLSTVNTFVDTLKFTTYTSDKSSEETKPFTGVVLTSFGRTKAEATYSISLSFDKTIFDTPSQVKLNVPNTVTTRSVTEQPTIFKKAEAPTELQ